MQALPQSDQIDTVLMERMRSGDDGALNAIVERHRGPLISYSLRIVRTMDVAEEVVQEAFVRLWENRSRWKSGGSVRGYLFKTARNLGLGRLRHLEVRRRVEPEVRMEMTSSPPSPLDVVVDEELRQALRSAVERLPARRRLALSLVRFQGYSLDEAAERMGLSRQTVANHVSLALDDLAEALKKFTD